MDSATMTHPHSETEAKPSIGELRARRLRRFPLLGMATLAGACSDGATIYLPGSGANDNGLSVARATDNPGGFGGDAPAAPTTMDPNAPDAVDAPRGGPPAGALPPAALDGAGVNEWAPPALRAAVALPDEDLARQALTLMGSATMGAEGSCHGCHSLGRPTLTRWQNQTDAFATACLGAPQLPDVAAVDTMVGCFQAHAAPSPSFSASTFGIYAAAAHLPWFSFVFEHGSEYVDDWQARHAQFVATAGMPRVGTRLAQAEFDVVAEWFARGLPRLFELVPEENGEACTAGLDPRLGEHVENLRIAGWKARNEQVPLLMYGCSSGQPTAACLEQVPLAADTATGVGWDVPGGAQIRILYDNTGAASNYWSRSSADGRYVASGLRDSGDADFAGQFVDLQQGQVIAGVFAYDPTFFPDNSGFMVQRSGYTEPTGPTNGTPNAGDTAVICNQSVLADSPDGLTGDEAGCTAFGGQIGLYQQLAKSIDGDDYWVVFGSFDEDNGGFSPVLDNPSAAFESQSAITFVPFINQGTGFATGTPARVKTPLAGDPMLSPSGRLLVTRLKGREYMTEVDGSSVVRAEQSGYALHLVSATENGDVSLSDVGRICLQGGKAAISYDERWLVLHHYVTASDAVPLGFSGPDDPAFADYEAAGASNLYLVDLLDGSSRPITHMAPGQYALFPHFRSDGWIYFVVRTLAGEEYFAASNAAVLLASPN
jgi:hypothetical protein